MNSIKAAPTGARYSNNSILYSDYFLDTLDSSFPLDSSTVVSPAGNWFWTIEKKYQEYNE